MIRRLLPYFRPHLARFAVALTAMAGVAALTAATMWILKQVVDKVLLEGDLATLKTIVLLLLLLYFIKGCLAYVHDYLASFAGQSIVRELRNRAYGNLQSLSMDFFTRHDSAGIIARLTADAQLVQNTLTKIPIVLVRDGLTVVFLTGFIFYLHWKFALMAVIILPAAGLVIARYGKSLRKTSRKGQQKMSDLYLRIQESILGAPVVKAYQREDYEKDRFVSENESYFRISMRNARTESLSTPSLEFLGAVGMALILWMGGRDVINGVWTAGAFFAFIGSALQMYQPVKNFSKSNVTLQQGLTGAERIFQVIDAQPTVVEIPGARPVESFKSEIRFENVGFSYRPDRPVLKGIDLVISKGEAVALVGPSGSGKTTLAHLILRFYDPSEGRVLLDGQDLRQVRLADLRRLIGVVTQETLLFNATVRENIAYAKAGAAEEELVAAAQAANAWEFIEKLPQGLDTPVGERGVLLSGGQRQRLAMARAILRNPPILLLDEATSALDAASERLVQDAVEKLMHNRTVIAIAHRLATVKSADRIVVLDQGSLMESGTHQELLTRKGLYHRLYELQVLEG
jgi:ATP-binding cassette, subfamily B, bacterial MsbA